MLKKDDLKIGVIKNNKKEIKNIKEKKDNKNEENILESKDLKISIMTDNASNFFNNQGILLDNYSSTSYQTLQKILNKVEAKPSKIIPKNNLSHLQKNSDSLYRTKSDFKLIKFNNNNFSNNLEKNNSKYVKNNNLLNGKIGLLTPTNCKPGIKLGAKTEFNNPKKLLYNKSENQNQKFFNIEIDDIISDANNNINTNFNSSNNNFNILKNERIFITEQNDFSKNQNIIPNKTLTLSNGKKVHSKIFKSPNLNNKKYLKDLINNPYNPYSTNWKNSFLKKGFLLGLKYKTIHFGVPSLRIRNLKKKVILPPVYKVKYNQYSDNNKEINSNENIVTYYNKDKTIKSLNLYLNLKQKSEAELMNECKKKIMKELNIIVNEKEEDENEDEEEESEDDESNEGES